MKTWKADWPAPAWVHALTTTRLDGHSDDPYTSNNLALHVNDQDNAVLKNRHALRQHCSLTQEPAWLNQTHSTRCVRVENDPNRDADAAITSEMHQPLAILTADCLPILLCNQEGTEVAAIHAGWRGLAHGIIENTLRSMQSHTTSLHAWIGPGICAQCYPVGDEMRDTFLQRDHTLADGFEFRHEQWHADLPYLAQRILQSSNLLSVSHANACTFEKKELFYSYRRTAQTGRMATLIWFSQKGTS